MALSDEDIKLLEARVAELERELDKKREEETAAKVRSEAAQQVASETFEAWLALGNEAGAIFDALFQVQNLLFDERTKKIIDRINVKNPDVRRLACAQPGGDDDWS
jgi:hypothetical protein